MTELDGSGFAWIVLLLLGFSAGWAVGRLDLRQLLSEAQRLPESYFRGLNLLLKDQPDKAVEVLIEASRVDPEAVDLQFSLGALFRRRGEIIRAVHMHQSLLTREDIGEDLRLEAMLELGRDYLAAGLLDRAEEAFVRLLASPRSDEARDALMGIYETQGDWQQARQVVEGGQRPDAGQRLAHYCCERALAAPADEARRLLFQAISLHPGGARARVMLGDLEAEEGRPAAAIAAWQEAEHQLPGTLPLVAMRIADAALGLGDAALWADRLHDWSMRHAGDEVLQAMVRLDLAVRGEAQARDRVLEVLRVRPSLAGVNFLARAFPDDSPVATLLRTVADGADSGEGGVYRCRECGFAARAHDWRCPACRSWDSFPARRTCLASCPEAGQTA